MALTALLWHLRVEKRDFCSLWLGKGWTHGGKLCTLPPALELLHLLGYFALKHCVGSIIVGLQQRIRRLKRNAAADWFALEKVRWGKPVWNNFDTTLHRTWLGLSPTAILEYCNSLLNFTFERAAKRLLGGRGCFGGFVHYWNGFSKLRRSILVVGSASLW